MRPLAAVAALVLFTACQSPYLPLKSIANAQVGGGGNTSGGTGGGGGGGTVIPTPFTITDGMAGSLLLGQDLYTTSAAGTTNKAMSKPSAIAIGAGKLFVAQAGEHVVKVYNSIPTVTNAPADVVIGDSGFGVKAAGSTSYTGSATGLDFPQGVAVSGSKLLVSDCYNLRVLIFSTLPTSNLPSASLAIGQTSTTDNTDYYPSITDKVFGYAAKVRVFGSKVFVVDTGNNRVLIFSSVPTSHYASANLVLGQATMSAYNSNRGGSVAATGMYAPSDVWSDGTKVVVMDSRNNRVLIWNTFPTVNGQAADVVLGQADMTHNGSNRDPGSAVGLAAADTLYTQLGNDCYFTCVAVDQNGRLFVGDSGNHRVLIWNSLPTANGQAADHVLGQSTFTSSSLLAASATAIRMPSDIAFDPQGNAWIVDATFNRVVRYGSN